jgi:hypothetical protein
VTTGLGAQTTFHYASLAQNGAPYTKEAGAAYPVADVQIPLRVVTRVDVGNGIGGFLSTSHAYVGARTDLHDRGFLGFRRTIATDLQTGIVQTNTFRQDFPFLGLASSTTRSIGSLTLNNVNNTYQFANVNEVPGALSSPSNLGAPYRVSVARTDATSADLNGTLMPRVTTTYQYDVFGNATQVVVSTFPPHQEAPDHTKTTTNTYVNNTAAWHLGRLTSATVTSTQP